MAHLRTALVFGVLAAASLAFPQSGAGLGLEVGWYFPRSKVVRDAFGSSIWRFGVGPVGTRRPTAGKVTPEIGLLAGSNSGNRFLIIPVTLGYEHHLADEESRSIPYLRASAGAAYFDYSLTAPAVSGRRVGGVGTLEAGVVFEQRLRVAAKLIWFSEQSGVDFSGLQFSATFAVWRF